MMEENEYKTAKKELTEASLPILKPMMEEINTALGNTKYSFKINDLDKLLDFFSLFIISFVKV